jgi:hypothetical protein
MAAGLRALPTVAPVSGLSERVRFSVDVQVTWRFSVIVTGVLFG